MDIEGSSLENTSHSMDQKKYVYKKEGGADVLSLEELEGEEYEETQIEG